MRYATLVQQFALLTRGFHQIVWFLTNWPKNWFEDGLLHMILTIHQKGKTVKMVNMKQNSLLLKDAKSTGASSAPDLLEIIIVL